jgi:hypothetical protein
MSSMALAMRQFYSQHDCSGPLEQPKLEPEPNSSLLGVSEEEEQEQELDGANPDAPFIVVSITQAQPLTSDMRDFLGLRNDTPYHDHTVTTERGEHGKERFTMLNHDRRMVFQAVMLDGKRHGKCYGWTATGGGCFLYYDRGAFCGCDY